MLKQRTGLPPPADWFVFYLSGWNIFADVHLPGQHFKFNLECWKANMHIDPYYTAALLTFQSIISIFFSPAQYKTDVPAVRAASQMDACHWIFEPCRVRLTLHRQAADWLHTNTVAAAWHLLRQPRSQSVWSPTLIALNSCQKEHCCLLISACLPRRLLHYLLCVCVCVCVTEADS